MRPGSFSLNKKDKKKKTHGSKSSENTGYPEVRVPYLNL